MKPGYILIFIFLAVGSLLGSLHMDYPYPFFIVLGLFMLCFRLMSKNARKKRERALQEQMFLMNMRRNNQR